MSAFVVDRPLQPPVRPNHFTPWALTSGRGRSIRGVPASAAGPSRGGVCVEALAGISSRILEIQSRMAQLTAPPRMIASTTPYLGTLSTAPSPSSTPTSSPSALAFGTILDEAVATSTVSAATSRTTTTLDAPGSGLGLVDAKGVPTALIPYGNGKVPGEALSPIAGTNHKLWSPAARSFEALRDAAGRDGVSIGITDSYRTYESQVSLAERKGLYSQGGLAARPGTSDHGWGIAMDLGLDPQAQAWMRTHAKSYGFVEDTPREPWHWGYHPTH